MSILHNNDFCTKSHSFCLVVSYINHCLLLCVVKSSDFSTHCYAELGIKVRKRLVKQEYFWLTNDCTAYGNTLALTAGKSLRLSLKIFCKTKLFCCLTNLAVNLCLVNFTELKTKSHVIVNCHVRIKRIVLEYHSNIAVLWRNIVHFNSVNKKLSF